MFLTYSMVMEEPEVMSKIIMDAAVATGSRVILQSSWSKMGGSADVPDCVFLLGNCPHDWLFENVSALHCHCHCYMTKDSSHRSPYSQLPLPP